MIVTGVCLSLSLVLAGFWLVRGRPRRVFSLPVLGVACLFSLALLGCITDNTYLVAPDPLSRFGDGHLEGKALLEIDDRSEGNSLILHQDSLKALADVIAQQPSGGKE